MSEFKRRRVSSSSDEPDVEDSFDIDVSQADIQLSSPSVIVSPQTSPCHGESLDANEPRDGELDDDTVFSSQASGDWNAQEGGLISDQEADNGYMQHDSSWMQHEDRKSLDITDVLEDSSSRFCEEAEQTIQIPTGPIVPEDTGTSASIENYHFEERDVVVQDYGDDDESDDSTSVESSRFEESYESDESSVLLSDTEISDQEEEIDSNRLDPHLYQGAHITVNESMTAILSYIIRHEISGKEIEDLLTLINLHCRKEGNKMRTSLYLFKKYFSVLDVQVVYHYYCANCYEKLPDKKAKCPNIDNHPESEERNVFLELPLMPQLQALFSKEEFFTNFNYNKRRTKLNSTNIEDIFDGQLYQELIQKGFIGENNPLNFTAMLNTDGVPVFHSKQKSLWPVFFNVNELPPDMRFRQENTLIAGLWFGGKPHVNLLFAPLLPSFQAISKGFHVKPFGSEKLVKVRGLVMSATCDLPAKIMCLGMASYSGRFGCQICKIPGGSVKIIKKVKKKIGGEKKARIETSVWVYKYDKNLELRNHDETVKFSQDAQKLLCETKDPETNVFGVKFPSAFFNIMYDAIRGFSVDDLHTLYLGVTKKLQTLWFEPKHSSKPFSIRKHLLLVDKRLKSVKLPNFLEHGVVHIEGNLSNWKGKDFLTWLHYLSIPILNGILPDKYLEHHIELVSCLQLLQSSSISRDDLIKCERKLHNYVKKFEILYGTCQMSMVFHLLLHLVFVVTNLGPLKYNSCFPYEGLNGEILKMIHGTRYIETQLASGTYLLQKLPEKLKSLQPGSDVKAFCDRVLHPSKRLKILEQISDDTFTVGTYKEMSTLNNYVTAALGERIATINDQSILNAFLRLKKGKHLFFSKKYDRTTRTNSYTCSYSHDGSLKYGEIDLFVKFSSGNSSLYSYFAIIEIVDATPYFVCSKEVVHMKEYTLTGKFIAVEVSEIKQMMVCIEIADCGSYICDPLDHSLKS